ncbi:MAG: ribonuclease E/G [Reyranellaceae bacterium]
MSAIDEICVRRRDGGNQVALVAAGRLVELRLDTGAPPPGAIVVGRVQTPSPDNAAVFVDIGAERSGFLRQVDMIGEARDRPAPGDPVLVQIVRAAGDGKGARLSMKLALPGRFVVLRPQETGVALSERIGDDGVRGRLAAALADLATEAGLTVRTAAAEIEDEPLRAELLRAEALRLAQAWDAIRARALQAKPPQVLSAPEDALGEAVREHGRLLRRVVVDDRALRRPLEALRQRHGDAFAIELQEGEPSGFDQHDLDAQIEQALAPEVALPGGGSIAIEPTRAFTAIDVDSGPARNALAVNLEAAEVVAQQLRLRNIGGAVLIDFIALRPAADRDRVLGRLALHLAADPLPTQVLGWTRLGLAEVARARRGRPLAEALAERASA